MFKTPISAFCLFWAQLCLKPRLQIISANTNLMQKPTEGFVINIQLGVRL